MMSTAGLWLIQQAGGRLDMALELGASAGGGKYKQLGAELGVGIQGFSGDVEYRALPWLAPTLSFRRNKDTDWNVAGGLTFRMR